MELQGKSVLIVEDDDAVSEVLCDYFMDRGATVLTAENGQRAIRLLKRLTHNPDLVVTDIVMPDGDGIGLSIYLRKHQPSVPIIAISGGGYVPPAEYLRSARSLGAWVALEKPVSSSTLDSVVATL